MPSSPSYAITLILLSPPLGWFGLHHFYLGNRRKGFLYILLFLTGIPVLLATSDFIITLKRGREKFIQKHGSEEELDEYYIQQLMRRKPEVITVSPEERQKYISEIREGKDAEDVMDSKENNESDEFQEETKSEGRDGSIYSDYYGDWK